MAAKTKNNAAGTIASGILSGATTIALTAGHGARFPTCAAPDYFFGTLEDSSANRETVKVTGRSTDSLTVVRGSSPLAFIAGDKFELRPCEELLNAMDQEALQATAASGTDTYTGTMSPVPNGWNTDQIYPVKFANANTAAAPTYEPNSYGAKTIKKPGGYALSAGDIQAGMIGFLHNNGTDLILLNPAKGALRGKQTVWVPASAMLERTTNGAAQGRTELATNKVMLRTLDFDASTIEYAQFQVAMPKSWDKSTITAKFMWTVASGSGDVIWGIQAVAHSNDDALDAAFGTGIEVTDTVLAANDSHASADSTAMTVGGSPAARDLVTYQVYRNASAGGDTLAVDAKLLGVELTVNFDASDDS